MVKKFVVVVVETNYSVKLKLKLNNISDFFHIQLLCYEIQF